MWSCGPSLADCFEWVDRFPSTPHFHYNPGANLSHFLILSRFSCFGNTFCFCFFWKQGAKKWFIIYITNFLLNKYFFEAHPILRHTLLQCWARSDFHRYNFPQRKWCGNQSDWMWRGWSQLVILRVLWHCLTMEFFKWHPFSSNLSGLIHL